MTFYFNAHRTYMTRDKHDSRRRWLVHEFKTPHGVIWLKQRLRVSHVKRTVTYCPDESGR